MNKTKIIRNPWLNISRQPVYFGNNGAKVVFGRKETIIFGNGKGGVVFGDGKTQPKPITDV